MPKVTYIEHGGETHVIDVPVGESVMQGAVSNGVPGIDADCGGQCACATCHVFVDPAWFDQLPAPQTMETEMLNFATATEPVSRLACQIVMRDDLDGLIVRLPEGQH